jgi:outer membrane lipoprotein SlyB
MEPAMSTNPISNEAQRSRIHPLVAGAAVAVILASATGIAAMTGILPSSKAVSAPPTAVQPAAAQVASAPVAQQQSYAQSAPQSTVQARPAAHHHHSAPTQSYANNNSESYGGGAAQRAPQRTAPIDPFAGEVVSITPVQTAEPTTGLGALGGAVAGGLIGNQIGNGRGRTVATIAGALGGGLAGNGIEHAVRKQTSYQVQVRMQDGSYRNFTYQTAPNVQIGQRVHVSGDSLVAS